MLCPSSAVGQLIRIFNRRIFHLSLIAIATAAQAYKRLSTLRRGHQQMKSVVTGVTIHHGKYVLYVKTAMVHN